MPKDPNGCFAELLKIFNLVFLVQLKVAAVLQGDVPVGEQLLTR